MCNYSLIVLNDACYIIALDITRFRRNIWNMRYDERFEFLKQLPRSKFPFSFISSFKQISHHDKRLPRIGIKIILNRIIHIREIAFLTPIECSSCAWNLLLDNLFENYSLYSNKSMIIPHHY